VAGRGVVRRLRATARWTGRAIAVALAIAGTTAATGASSVGVPASWTSPNSNLDNTRLATSSITASNIASLKIAWKVPLTGVGADDYRYAATPLIAAGVVYTQDLASTVTAYRESNGAVLWSHVFPDAPSAGPNGVTLSNGRLYGATPTYAFALDATSGKLLWRSTTLTRNGHEGIDMAPAVADGLVYVSTVPGNASAFYAGEGVGRLFALDAQTGKVRWRFNTVPTSLWGKPTVNSGGGVWYSPAISGDSVYADIGNPAPFPNATSRPGPNLYTDSVVKLDATSGKLVWYRQVLPHDLYDWDLEAPPILTTAGGRAIVVAAGKMGYVYGLDATSGKLLWKTPVGIHNGHDNDDEKALAGSPPSLAGVVYPGSYGGVLTPLAVAGGVAYLPIVDLGTQWLPQETQQWGTAAGELDAVRVSDGKLLWSTKLGSPAFGAATISNDLVLTTTFAGEVVALSRSSGRIVWRYALPTWTNAPLAVAGNMLITAASIPHGSAQAELIAFRLS
jgi:outer membrane protein assembly factor BamB